MAKQQNFRETRMVSRDDTNGSVGTVGTPINMETEW